MNNTLGFTRLFPELKPTYFDPEALATLADAMQKRKAPNNFHLASGYVYLGQFITHDMTHLKGNQSTSHGVPLPLADQVQLRTPKLDLDSVYGNGFDDPSISVDKFTGKFRLGYSMDPSGKRYPGEDLPRQNLIATIADARNDENLIVAQLHCVFLRLHNHYIDQCPEKNDGSKSLQEFSKERFDCARRRVIQDYQRVVLYDFLYQLLDRGVWQHLVESNEQYLWHYLQHENILMPVEFSGAAFRMGHAMIRKSYVLNTNPKGSVFFEDLMRLTGKGGKIVDSVLPKEYVVDWNFFFPSLQNDEINSAGINTAKEINTHVPTDIPTGKNKPVSLALKNLLRGNELQLPCAQDIIQALPGNIPGDIRPDLLNEDELGKSLTLTEALEQDGLVNAFWQKTPLWYYILAEAKTHNKGKKLGKLGSLIVGETIIGALKSSHMKHIKWPDNANPDYLSDALAKHTMTNLIQSTY